MLASQSKTKAPTIIHDVNYSAEQSDYLPSHKKFLNNPENVIAFKVKQTNKQHKMHTGIYIPAYIFVNEQ